MPHSVGVDEIHPNKIGINSDDVTLIADDGIKLSCWFMYHNKNDRYEKLSDSSIRARRRILKECNMNGSITDSDDVPSDKVYANTDLKRRVPFYLRHCFPSNNENIGGRSRHFWELYNLMGVNVFVVFYRGYGNSSGVTSEDGFYLDAKAAYEYLLSRTDIFDKDKLFVYGYSIGGAVAIDFASKYKVSGLILENTFKDLKTVWSKVCPVFAKIPLFLDIFQVVKFESYSKIPNVAVPTLYIVGLMDRLSSPTDSIELYKKLWHHHHDTWLEAVFDYYRVIFRFIYDTNNINCVDCSYIYNFNQHQRPVVFDIEHEHKTESVGMEKSQNELSVGMVKSSLSSKNKKSIRPSSDTKNLV
ncbi:hypothetical protein FG379_001514 [Cryptosporidium bovis]|uniref:uncharacterized protein n=1 Tax=Cryptosporidium bovis TaxID=310047 RepID=UPI00351A26B6|nr:hypothetical protein FG379_001514 [Cryptosporidium bovis]